jgi:hypothetical protein
MDDTYTVIGVLTGFNGVSVQNLTLGQSSIAKEVEKIAFKNDYVPFLVKRWGYHSVDSLAVKLYRDILKKPKEISDLTIRAEDGSIKIFFSAYLFGNTLRFYGSIEKYKGAWTLIIDEIS